MPQACAWIPDDFIGKDGSARERTLSLFPADQPLARASRAAARGQPPGRRRMEGTSTRRAPEGLPPLGTASRVGVSCVLRYDRKLFLPSSDGRPATRRRTPSMLFLRLQTRTRGFAPDSVSVASVWVSRSGTDFTPQGESQVPRHAALPGRPRPPLVRTCATPRGPGVPPEAPPVAYGVRRTLASRSGSEGPPLAACFWKRLRRAGINSLRVFPSACAFLGRARVV